MGPTLGLFQELAAAFDDVVGGEAEPLEDELTGGRVAEVVAGDAVVGVAVPAEADPGLDGEGGDLGRPDLVPVVVALDRKSVGRETVCQSVYISVVAVSLKKKKTNTNITS